MKGYLHKIEDWFVIYDQRTMQDPSAEDGMLPLHPHDIAVSSFNFYNGKEVQFQIRRYDGTIPILNAWNGYAKLIDYDENGKPLTYWGGLKDRTCDHTNCREVCPECQILHISEECEEVKNWDSFVEEKNKELFAEEYANGKSSSEVFRDAHKKDFIAGYNKAKETLASSQTEISDEEIEKEAEKRSNSFNGFTTYEKSAWVMACKWYREQLKIKK